MKKLLFKVLTVLIITAITTKSFSQKLDVYDWPVNPSEALLSDKYKVTLEVNGVVKNSMVIKSESKDLEIPDFAKEFRGGRTFNWTMFSYDFLKPITITVEKIFGEIADDIELVPSPYKLEKTISADKKKVSFKLSSSKYVAVNFKSTDNLHTSDGVIKHMLMIFADTLETDIPDKNASNVHVYSKASTTTQLNNADIIYFPKGYHDLKNQYSNTISNMASAINKKGKRVYFEGGAYVHGRISGSGQSNVKIYGRGALSGRDFKWSERLAFNGGKLGVDSFDPMESHIGLGSNNAGFNIIDGIVVCDGAAHGINLGHDATYLNTKIWVWHPNNDGFRPWGANNKIDRCFIKACDDALYNKGLTVTNTVFWPGFNGSIVCLGWDGSYNTENSKLIDNYIIYPEWRGMGNNNGILMSQIDYDMKGVNVYIQNLTVDGNIPALVNLHTNSGKEDRKDFNLPQDFSKTVGEVSGIVFENVKVFGKQVSFDGDAFQQTQKPNKGIIRGAKLTNGDTYYMSNISFKDVEIEGVCLESKNVTEFINIDAATTKDIRFKGCTQIVLSNEEPAEMLVVYPNPSSDWIFIKNIKEDSKLEMYNSSGRKVLSQKGNQINISSFPSGIYILSVHESKRVKIVKQ